MPKGKASEDSLIDTEVYNNLKVYSRRMLLEAFQEKKALEDILKKLEDDEVQLLQKLAEIENSEASK